MEAPGACLEDIRDICEWVKSLSILFKQTPEHCSKCFHFLVPIILAYVLAYVSLKFSKGLLTKRVLTNVLLTAGLRQMKQKVTNILLLSS